MAAGTSSWAMMEGVPMATVKTAPIAITVVAMIKRIIVLSRRSYSTVRRTAAGCSPRTTPSKGRLSAGALTVSTLGRSGHTSGSSLSGRLPRLLPGMVASVLYRHIRVWRRHTQSLEEGRFIGPYPAISMDSRHGPVLHDLVHPDSVEERVKPPPDSAGVKAPIHPRISHRPDS